MIHDSLAKRIKALEARTPKEDGEFDAFLSCCSDDELRRIVAITDKEEQSTEDITFLRDLEVKYETASGLALNL